MQRRLSIRRRSSSLCWRSLTPDAGLCVSADTRPTDPGLESLVTLLHLQGVAADREQIRHRLGTNKIGAPEMLRCAKDFGLKARATRTTWSRLAGTPLPAIATLNDGGFLVIAKAGDDKVLVQSPLATRPALMTRGELLALWDGGLILMARRAGLSDMPSLTTISLASIVTKNGFHHSSQFSERSPAMPKHSNLARPLPALAAALLLAACSAETAPAPRAERPVQVQSVAFQAEDAARDFVGVVRARYETDLGFRVGGKMVARPVNMGDRVHEQGHRHERHTGAGGGEAQHALQVERREEIDPEQPERPQHA